MKLGIYKHFKGNFYELIAIAKDSETLEELAVYKALYESEKFGKDQVWVRALKNFNEIIERDGKKTPRFTFQETIEKSKTE